MLCRSCGHENREDASFCDGCGAPLTPTCPKCGARLRPEARFCDKCGTSLTQPVPTARIPTPAPSPTVPTSFASGRYQVKRFLGEGGWKRVYLAHDTRLDRDVALAVIKTEGLDAPVLARVRREAQAMGRLGDHPHIITVFDISEEGGQTYIVSQYVAGGELKGLLQRAENHRLPLDDALRIANQVCQALEYAHSRGVIHRDVKPSNIWLTQEGSAKLGDFGLAAVTDLSRLTQVGMMVGTFAYMPPEQALGREADARSDLYSLGAMLYEMVTGRPPFLGDDAVAIISQHINTAPVAPSWHNPEVPRALEALILRLLAKAPEERPESAATVHQALTTISSTTPTVAERVVQEEANPLDRLAGGLFVGREKEMDELRAGLEDALCGRGRLLMLVGEPGIGKTRTAEELATYASLRSAQVLWGRCYEGEGAPAYWPWVQVIRSYVHDREPQDLMSQMGPGAADIAQVVSEVRERLPELPEPPPLAPEQARFRLFDSITTFLRNASKGQPLLLVLDDLHWADKPSLLLLQFLARELRGARLLVLGTYRDVELRRQHPLSQTLGELARAQLSQRVLLRGLTERDVARFIEMTAGLEPPAALVAAVYTETEGNPFFVNEIVRLLVADGRLQKPEDVESWSVTIPQGVREVIGQRLDHVSKGCSRVLTIASVIGREFGQDALERVADISGDRLVELLEEAVSARIVSEVPPRVGRYRFSHSLIREVLYEELPAVRRVRLHQRVANALEDLHGARPESHLAELAHHFLEGARSNGDSHKAVAYAVRAAEHAADRLAYEEAVELLERALHTVQVSEADDSLRCDVLLALGDAQRKSGEPKKAQKTFERAAAMATELGMGERVARAALGISQVAEAGDRRAVVALEEALSALAEADSTPRVRLLSELAVKIRLSGAPERVASLSQQAVEMARRMGDMTALANALRARHLALWGPENIQDRLSTAVEIIRLANEVRDRQLALEAHQYRIVDLLELGEMALVDQEIQASRSATEELPYPQHRYYTALFLAMRALLEGRFDECEPLAQRALAMGQQWQPQAALMWFGAQLANLRRDQGRLQEIESAVKGFAEQYAWVPAWRCALALVHSELGRMDEARQEFDRLSANDFADLPRDFTWLNSVAFLSEICAFLKDASRAQSLYALLLPYAGRNIVVGGAVCYGSASRNLGLLAATMLRPEDAAQHFQTAIEANARLGARPWVARTQLEYSEMLLARGHPNDWEKAFSLLTEALDIAQELGMRVLVERGLGLKLQLQGVDTTSPYSSIGLVASAIQTEQPDLRPHAAPDGTVTILFSDIEGSTSMTERLGDQRWLELLRSHNGTVRECLRAHNGYEVKTEGDGFMLAFSSARRALQCAIAIQRAFAAYNETAQEPIRVRIGLHTGEAIKEAQDFYGRHVILASRIADEAQGGQILVSSLLKELTESGGDIQFSEGREVELKGLSGRQRVYQVEWAPSD